MINQIIMPICDYLVTFDSNEITQMKLCSDTCSVMK